MTLTATYAECVLIDGVFEYNRFMYVLADGQTDPYTTHLANVQKYEDGEWIEISDAYGLAEIRTDGKYRLVADIDLNGWNWQPIGTNDVPFTGAFDGNGHKIFNLTTKSNKDMSVFGVCSGAEIRNVVIADTKITVDSEGDVKAAFISHKADNRTYIVDCEVSGELNVTSAGDVYAAGICAYNEASIVTDCNSGVKINVTSDATAYAAGICAYVYSDAKLEYCYNSAIITGDADVFYNGAIIAESDVSSENTSLIPSLEYCYDLTVNNFGDVNGDGSVTPVDTVIFARYLAGWTSVQSSFVADNADVNDDGQITLIDTVALARHLAGWQGYERLPVIMD